MDKSGGGMRKRAQINKASQMMFLWIVGVSAVVGFSVVLIIFLAQKIWFGEKVIAEKLNTVSVLEQNIGVVDELKDNVRVLNTNVNLLAVRADDNDPALQSVLDALPADANSTAMASSLQTKLLSGVPGVTIESLKVDPIGGVETEDASSDAVSDVAGEISFTFSVSASKQNQSGLRKVLQQLEKSIRPFNIVDLTIESQGARVVMTARGVGYYEPAQQVALTDKVVRP